MKIRYSTKDFILMCMFVAVGIVLQTVDNMIMFGSVPGGKLGLSNIVTLLNIFILGGNNALLISVMRAFLGSLLFGGVSALPYSVGGAFFSTVAMIYFKNKFYPELSEIGLSIIGAATHNFVQVVVAAIIMSSLKILSYISVLMLVSVAAGFVTGFQVKYLNKRLLNSSLFKKN